MGCLISCQVRNPNHLTLVVETRGKGAGTPEAAEIHHFSPFFPKKGIRRQREARAGLSRGGVGVSNDLSTLIDKDRLGVGAAGKGAEVLHPILLVP